MDIRQEMARYGKLVHEKGLVIGDGGNISVREKEGLIIKRRGADMSSGDVNDYVYMGIPASVTDQTLASSEFQLHSECYLKRPDAGAVMHVHSPYMVAAAERARALKSVSYEFDCVLQGPVPVLGFILPGSKELASMASDLAGKGHNAVLLRKHGGFSVGRDMREAYLRILALERACLTFLHL